MGSEIELRKEQSLLEKLPEKEFKICAALHRMNQLRSYKLGVIEILEWKDSILKLLPEVNISAIDFVIDKLITGELDYDANIGIKNITIGLNKIEKNEGSYRVKPYRPW